MSLKSILLQYRETVPKLLIPLAITITNKDSIMVQFWKLNLFEQKIQLWNVDL
jgi:hypothetical protein